MNTFQHDPQKPWRNPEADNRQGQALDQGMDMPEHISERLSQARRQAVQDYERGQRSARRKSWGTTPWLAGAGLVAAAVSAVVIAPGLPTNAPTTSPMPIELIAADDDLEFFQTMEYLEWSLDNESTS
jgi:anti-sigma-K factor RskA